jgi:TnpA family transposase
LCWTGSWRTIPSCAHASIPLIPTGFTEQLFGLCYLLGYSFMPRLRDLADQQLYRIDPESPPDSLRPLLRSGLDVTLLGEQSDQLVRGAASLRNRVARAHVVLQRLANASPAERVAKALTTLGRIVKTIYILRYIHEEELRQRVQLQLNRGESRHGLARWLFSQTAASAGPATTKK